MPKVTITQYPEIAAMDVLLLIREGREAFNSYKPESGKKLNKNTLRQLQEGVVQTFFDGIEDILTGKCDEELFSNAGEVASQFGQMTSRGGSVREGES